MSKRDVLRFGLSGMGFFSAVIADAVMRSKKAEIVTCFDAVPERAKAASRQYGCQQEKSYEELVKRKDIDGVFLVTPNAFHREQAVLAAQHGKHVFVEKPIANTIADGKEMIASCEKAGVVLLIGHMMRRFGGIRKTKDLIESGALGKLIMVEANASSGQGWTMTPDEFRWRGDDSGCPGGALMTMGVHPADNFNYLFGPVRTASSYFNKLYIPADVEDVTATILQFESGMLGYLGANYASPRVNWMRVYGTEANLSFIFLPPDLHFSELVKSVPKADQYSRLELFEKGKDRPREIQIAEGDPILEEVDEFCDCIQTGKRPETDGQAALAALALIRAAIESARTGNQAKVEMTW